MLQAIKMIPKEFLSRKIKDIPSYKPEGKSHHP